MAREKVIQWARPKGSTAAAANFQLPRAAETGIILALGGSLAASLPSMAHAATPALTSKVVKAFDPILDLLTAVAYPFAATMVSAAFLLWMGGNREKGMKMLRSAAMGYIGLQFAPTLLSLIVEVGSAVKAVN